MICPVCERELVDGRCEPCDAYAVWLKEALRDPPPKRTIGYGYTRWAFDVGFNAGKGVVRHSQERDERETEAAARR